MERSNRYGAPVNYPCPLAAFGGLLRVRLPCSATGFGTRWGALGTQFPKAVGSDSSSSLLVWAKHKAIGTESGAQNIDFLSLSGQTQIRPQRRGLSADHLQKETVPRSGHSNLP